MLEPMKECSRDFLGNNPAENTIKKAFLLDRDGVINVMAKDIIKPEQFEMIDGAAEAIKTINDAGYLAIVVTNQPIISKGFVTFEGMDVIHQKMHDALSKAGAKVNAIYLSPTHPKSGFEGEIPELKKESEFRKPNPGLLLKAMEDFNLDKDQCYMVGDSPSDIVAGKRAEVKTVFITGSGSGAAHEKDLEAQPTMTFDSLAQAVKEIL